MLDDSKFAALRADLQSRYAVLVAFSGGVDSAFLLRVAVDELGERAHAITCVSPTMARSEIEDARRLGAELGLANRHHVVESNELTRPGFAENPTDRCAMCKTELMEHAQVVSNRIGVRVVALGTNVDDLGDYRPGIAAARDQGAISPLLDAGMNKQEIRYLSKALGLRTWDKPQLACLSSRFPYGTRITAERLTQVDAFEDGLRALGFRQLRVRYHEATARLEIDVEDLTRIVEPGIREQVVALGRASGFSYITLDLAGFRSGSLNEPLVQLGRKSA